MDLSLGTHYSLAFTDRLFRFGKTGWELIKDNFPANSAIMIYFRGFSGIAHGLSVNMAYNMDSDKNGIQLFCAYIRKENESLNSHGVDIETNWRRCEHRLDHIIFVDDFICSGDTFLIASAKIRSFIKNNARLIDYESEKFARSSIKCSGFIMTCDRDDLSDPDPLGVDLRKLPKRGASFERAKLVANKTI